MYIIMYTLFHKFWEGRSETEFLTLCHVRNFIPFQCNTIMMLDST
jgi:hypothetical protein